MPLMMAGWSHVPPRSWVSSRVSRHGADDAPLALTALWVPFLQRILPCPVSATFSKETRPACTRRTAATRGPCVPGRWGVVAVPGRQLTRSSRQEPPVRGGVAGGLDESRLGKWRKCKTDRSGAHPLLHLVKFISLFPLSVKVACFWKDRVGQGW